MGKPYRPNLFLGFTLCIAIFLRIYALDNVPPSPSLDEASISYNAYSILKTGADEYGSKYPLTLRAYDDWRPALYVYVVMPFVALLKLGTLAVRLPSVTLSLITVITLYFLAKEVFRSWKHQEKIALAAAFLLSISPWHIYISRLGHEVNLGLTLVVLGVYFFFRAVHSNQSFYSLLASSIFFGLSFYSYQSQKIMVPILVITLGCLWWRRLLLVKKSLVASVAIGGLLIIPSIASSLSPTGLIRYQATSAFSNEDPMYRNAFYRFSQAKEQGNLIGQVVFNRRLVPFYIFGSNYLSHFNPKWLFTGGPKERHKVPNMGLFYPWEAALFILGLIAFYMLKLDNRTKMFIALWFLSGPLPGAITTQAPHAMRAFTWLPVWQLFSALGAVSVFVSLRTHALRLAFITIFITGVLISLARFSEQYFTIFPRLQSESFQYALAEAIEYVKTHENEYEKVVFSNEGNLYQSYMFFLYYTTYEPRLYQKQGGTRSGGYAEPHAFGKYEFRPIHWPSESKDSGVLYVGNIADFPLESDFIKKIQNLNGTDAILIKRT